MTESSRNLFRLIIKIVAALAIFLFIGIFMMRVLGKDAPPETITPPLPTVQLISVKDFQKPIANIEAVGTVAADNDRSVPAEVPGVVEQVYVKIGDKVTVGQTLAVLNHDQTDIQLQQAAASIDRLQANITKMQVGARNEELQQSLASLDRAFAGVLQAKAQKEQALTSYDTSVKRAEANVKKAETAFKLDKQQRSDALQNALDDFVITLKKNRATMQDVLVFVGNILGEAPGESVANDAYENVLGATDRRRLRVLRLNFEQAIDDADALERIQDSVTATESSINQHEALFLANLQKQNTLLDDVRVVFDNTPAQSTYPESALSAMKAQIQTKILANNNAVNAHQDGKQRVADAKRILSAQNETLQIEVDRAQLELDSAIAQGKKNIEIADNTIVVQEAALQQAQAAHDLLKAGPRSEDLAPLYAQVREATAQYQLLQRNKDKAFITAPYNAEVAAVPVKIGDTVGNGQTVVALVNNEKAYIATFVSDRDRLLIKKGAKVRINETIAGTIDRIAPRVDPKTRKIEVHVSFNDKNLLVGQVVNVSIALPDQNTSTFYLPLKSVSVEPGSRYIYVVNDGMIEQRGVITGNIVGETIEILGGIDTSMNIVSSVRGVKPGDEVQVDQ